MTPVPPFTLSKDQQLEYTQRFFQYQELGSHEIPNSEYQIQPLLEKISDFMLENYSQDEYETLVLDRFEQQTIVRVLFYTPDGYQAVVFYETD